MDILQGFVQFLKIPASCSLSLPPSLLCRRALLSREWEPFLNLVTLSVEPSQIQLRQKGQEFSARWGSLCSPKFPKMGLSVFISKSWIILAA